MSGFGRRCIGFGGAILLSAAGVLGLAGCGEDVGSAPAVDDAARAKLSAGEGGAKQSEADRTIKGRRAKGGTE